jgi:ribose-phosphate pyrophosphokinase
MSILINKKTIETFNFSGGECHVKILPEDIVSSSNIEANLNSSDDIMRLILCVDAIRRINPDTKILLTIPYFPYARQDRVCNPGEALSVKVMANLINSLNCNLVRIFDPHSDVTPALINNCEVASLDDIICNSNLKDAILRDNLTLISPDAGAEKKVKMLAKRLSSQDNLVNSLCASKTRDTLTGNITSTEIHGDVQGGNLIVIDDICDGGRTFTELAKVLKQKGANDIYLYVTHGIFSKGLDVLKDHFKHVYCNHTMLDEELIDQKTLTVLRGAYEVS